MSKKKLQKGIKNIESISDTRWEDSLGREIYLLENQLRGRIKEIELLEDAHIYEFKKRRKYEFCLNNIVSHLEEVLSNTILSDEEEFGYKFCITDVKEYIIQFLENKEKSDEQITTSYE